MRISSVPMSRRFNSLTQRSVFVAGFILGSCLPASASEKDYYSEPYRPQFHFTAEKNWMNDPNGMVFYEGEYHLFYQYNPFGDKWGHMSWGHAVSPDMVHWKHLPLALPEADGVMIFSGSAVVDWKNSSGFGKDGKPPLIAIYTGHQSSGQAQCIAYSNDKGRTWTKYPGNPVLDLHLKDFRDPKVQWHEPTQRWIMTVSVSTEHKVRFYSSANLKEWTLLSEFGPAGAGTGIWECPDLFELPVEGSKEKRWVLIVNIGSGSVAGGSGGEYFIGMFDGTRFTAEKDDKTDQSSPTGGTGHWLDYGKDYYAAVSWNNVPKSDGRRLWLGWMSNWEYGQDVPTSPWRSAMSIPRSVSLHKTPTGIRLAQQPVRELESLRQKRHHFKGGDISEANEWLKKNQIEAEQLEIAFDFTPSRNGTGGIQVLKGKGEETVIGMDASRGRVFLDRTHSGKTDFNPKFSGVHTAPLGTVGKVVKVHIFVDACSVEAFVNEGESVFTDLVFPSANSRALEFFGENANTKIRNLNIWTLKSSWAP